MIRRFLLAGAAAASLAAGPAMAVQYTGAGFAIPDANALGASSTITLNAVGVVSHLDLDLLGFSHTWIGDLSGTLTHAGVTVDWMQRTNPNNSNDVNGNYIIRDGAPFSLNNAPGGNRAPGVYAPDAALSAFNGTPWAGDWTLSIADHAFADTGQLASWGLDLTSMGAGGAIPDGNPAGLSSTVHLAAGGSVDDLDFSVLGLQHTWMGDLSGTLSHGGVTVPWLQTDGGNSHNLNGDYTLSDAGLQTLDAASGDPRPPGVYRPISPLSAFHGMDAGGDWTLSIADHFVFDTGSFDGWNLDVRTLNVGPGGVPEPATWAMLIGGFGLAGARLRRRAAVA